MDYRLALMTGVDIPIKELQISIHQPTIKEISYMGEEDFFSALQFLNINKNNYLDQKDNITNFDLFIKLINNEKTINQKTMVLNLLTILFPNVKSFITPQSIILNDINSKNSIIIDNNNFNILQNIIQDIFCLNSESIGQNMNFNPKGNKAREIANKIMKGRQKIAKEKGENKISIFSRYLSILSIGTQQSLGNLINLTVYQIYNLMERYSLYLNWDIDIRSRLAGAKNNNQPDNWMKDLK